MLGFVYRNPAETIEWQDYIQYIKYDDGWCETINMGDFTIYILVPKCKWT